MDLLERDGALSVLVSALEAAARGQGRVVLVTGEPGIGKTSLVGRFVRDVGTDARVLIGTCDDLSIPRPLGPIRDLVGNVSEELERALASGAAPHEIQTLLLAELAHSKGPTVLIVEDLHWADNATCDAIAVLVRRIASLPALLVLTFRAGEAPPGHPLYTALGAARPGDSIFVELTPLSAEAVGALAGERAPDIYEATGGNPFYVTELLASPAAREPPPSVANAVLGRASRLDDASRRLLELVSVVPSRVDTSLLDTVMPGWAVEAEEPERRQLLEVGQRHVRFRHELARHAVRSSISSARRRGLHAEILNGLLAADADPANVVHHAEAAGAEDVVAEYALVAARRAGALASNREAYSHYRRAAQFVDRLPACDRAGVLEELANAAYLVGRIEDAFPAIGRAIGVYEQLGDGEAVGRCTRMLSRYHSYAGEGAPAWQAGLAAVAILEPLGESIELARAYSGLAHLAMLAENCGEALSRGERALDLATRLGDDNTRAHALVNLASARAQLDYRDAAPTLLEAYAFAAGAGELHIAGRALNNLAYILLSWARPADAQRYARQAVEYAEKHEELIYASYSRLVEAWARLRAGDWDEAERIARAERERGVGVAQLLAKTVLADLAVRRGDPDAAERVDDVAAHAERTGELQRVAPALELAVVSALTTDGSMPTGQAERALAEAARRRSPTATSAVRVAAWSTVAGIDTETTTTSAPYAAMLRRDWSAAADAFGEIGWTFDRALMLSLLRDADALVEALEIARSLGAEPLARRVVRQMRGLGIRVPAGPREKTRSNPAGLTARQLEVLGLLVEGLSNAEIADRLVVSPRTAEHHVAAVLTKVGATGRRDAARRATELGLLAPR
jgi:DNA-binding CsgD family transcriptional regulator